MRVTKDRKCQLRESEGHGKVHESVILELLSILVRDTTFSLFS
jgi:hypothetical protein